ncbi:uncharacterized protein MYCGRDRAFT_96138 [Zymoseptoria tritici IPO323]|uniref:Uncharacterized protein n=1 Tax=Zymoseptoria tritici (strain CBS 115943 / IPO323) TaxID=336722 RepID=F9XLK5_ZYMTI|nr:uncharacterized protein MYCGRDRAFT_96138 [Zymoseptoria tritici IPO323]EGP83793.1 hypothetical protein MYCGRDRAFT_96138 [Zymoseptoria tritici IPO323]
MDGKLAGSAEYFTERLRTGEDIRGGGGVGREEATIPHQLIQHIFVSLYIAPNTPSFRSRPYITMALSADRYYADDLCRRWYGVDVPSLEQELREVKYELEQKERDHRRLSERYWTLWLEFKDLERKWRKLSWRRRYPWD